MDLVIGQPGLCHGADLALPDVAFGLLGQAHVGAQQWVYGDGIGVGDATGRVVEQQTTVVPCGQWCVDQSAGGVEHGEVDGGAGGVEVAGQCAQPVGQWLFAAHAGQRSRRHVEAAGGLVDRVGQQGVGGQLGEDPVAVFEGGLHRRGEAYGVAQVVHPVVGVAVGLLARVERGRRVVGDFRLQRADFGERFGQFVEDRVDLRGVRCYVDGHLTGQHVALLPGGHQVAYRLGGPADHGGLRGGHHRDHGVVDAARHQLRKHLLGRQFHRCHGAGAGDTGHQRRPPADDAHSVFEAERAGDHRGRGLAQRVADDRAGRYAVGLHCGRQRDLHGKQGRLHPVDAGHDLGGGHGFGHREAGFRGDQWFDRGDGGGEYRFGGQQVGAHARPLRALPGEHPDRSAVVLADRGWVGGFAGGDFPQRLGQLRGGGGQYGGAHRPVSAPAGQGVGQIRRRQLGSLGVDPIGQPRGGLPQRVLRAGRQREQQRAVDTGCGRGVAWCTGFGGWHRCLLDNGVHIGARHAIR